MFEPVIFLNFFAFGYCFMTVLWLEIHDVFFSYFLLFNSVTFGVTAFKGDVYKKKRDNTWISFPRHRNQFQTSIKFSLSFKSWVNVVIGILNRLKSFRWYFLMFAINWIYWKVELLQHETQQ